MCCEVKFIQFTLNGNATFGWLQNIPNLGEQYACYLIICNILRIFPNTNTNIYLYSRTYHIIIAIPVFHVLIIHAVICSHQSIQWRNNTRLGRPAICLDYIMSVLNVIPFSGAEIRRQSSSDHCNLITIQTTLIFRINTATRLIRPEETSVMVSSCNW